MYTTTATHTVEEVKEVTFEHKFQVGDKTTRGRIAAVGLYPEVANVLKVLYPDRIGEPTYRYATCGFDFVTYTDRTATLIAPKKLKLTVHTNQQAFDAVARHLSTATERAVVKGACVYLAPETGARCAVGCLIDADALQMKAAWGALRPNGNAFTGGIEALKEVVNIDPAISDKLLVDLQNVHDNQNCWNCDLGFTAWSALIDVAVDHGLDCKVFDTLGLCVY